MSISNGESRKRDMEDCGTWDNEAEEAEVDYKKRSKIENYSDYGQGELDIQEIKSIKALKPNASNKFLSESSIPRKPDNAINNKAGITKKFKKRPFHFRLLFTNGAMFHKFLVPVSSAVSELRFNLTVTKDFTGVRLEAHDTFFTLANKSRYECDLEAGELNGVKLENDQLTGLSFCVHSESFMQTLGCAILKDTVLSITKYVDSSDKITFESITNENDVQTVYSCNVLAESRLESLKGMQFDLGYHVNIYLKTLKEQTMNAKKCGASTIFFSLFQSEDVQGVTHSRLSIGFKGTVTSGCHDFYQSAKKVEKYVNNGENKDSTKVIEWEPLPCLPTTDSENKMKLVSHNEYDNSKLRVFLNHMVSKIEAKLIVGRARLLN